MKGNSPSHDESGNIVVGYTSDSILMLDVDFKPQKEVIEFAKEYTEFHDLGSVLIIRTSESSQVDLFGNQLGNFCIIFGRILPWEETKWHIKEAYRLGMVKKNFLVMREIDLITIRVNAKNSEIPHPEVVYYLQKRTVKGVYKFLEYWIWHRNLGLKKVDVEELTEEKLREKEKEVKREMRQWLKIKAHRFNNN
jgi:hypothetical protein